MTEYPANLYLIESNEIRSDCGGRAARIRVEEVRSETADPGTCIWNRVLPRQSDRQFPIDGKHRECHRAGSERSKKNLKQKNDSQPYFHFIKAQTFIFSQKLNSKRERCMQSQSDETSKIWNCRLTSIQLFFP